MKVKDLLKLINPFNHITISKSQRILFQNFYGEIQDIMPKKILNATVSSLNIQKAQNADKPTIWIDLKSR